MIATIEAQHRAIDHDIVQDMNDQHGELGSIAEAVRKRYLARNAGVQVFFHVEQRLRAKQPGRDAHDTNAKGSEFARGRQSAGRRGLLRREDR